MNAGIDNQRMSWYTKVVASCIWLQQVVLALLQPISKTGDTGVAQGTRNTHRDSNALYEKVYTTLRERICLLDYPPAALISENALATEFDVSRPWIRGILHRLEFEGLVSLQTGGITVTTDDIKLVRDAYLLRIRLYEVLADEVSHTHITDAHIALIEDLLRQLRDLHARRDPRKWAQIHMAFQERFMSLVTNALLRKFIDQLYYRTVRVWLSILPDLDWETETDEACEEMENVIKALRAGDMRKAALIRGEDLPRYLGRLLSYLQGATGSSGN